MVTLLFFNCVYIFTSLFWGIQIQSVILRDLYAVDKVMAGVLHYSITFYTVHVSIDVCFIRCTSWLVEASDIFTVSTCWCKPTFPLQRLTVVVLF